MPTKINQGDCDYGVAAVAIGANLLVKRHTVANQVTLCGAAGRPNGVTQEGFASGADVTYYRPYGMALVTASAAVAIGDLVKTAASGKVAPEADVAVPTVYTIGTARSVAAGDGSTFEMEWL